MGVHKNMHEFSGKKWLLMVAAIAMLIPAGIIAEKWLDNNRIGLVCSVLLVGVVHPDFSSYSELIERASAGNDDFNRWAQYDLIDMYSHAEWGNCFPHDEEKFYQFLEKTAAQGWAVSQSYYSWVAGKIRLASVPYEVPEKITNEKQDINLSLTYMIYAAEKGVTDASGMLSAAYAVGKWGDVSLPARCTYGSRLQATPPGRAGAEVLCSFTERYVNADWGDDTLVFDKDYARSMTWLETGIWRDEEESVKNTDNIYDLARRHRYGQYGAENDQDRAFELFSQVAMDGKDARAMAELAWMYAEGAGTEQDVEMADALMKRALTASPAPERTSYEAMYSQLSSLYGIAGE